MALKDFLSLHSDDLRETFARKEYDPTRDRAALVKRLDNADNAFKSATPTKGKKMFRIANGVVELTLPFAIGGRSTYHIPSERFSDAIQHLKDAVTGGEADDDLKKARESGSVDGGEAAPARAPRAKREAGEGRYSEGSRGWSDERRARFAETIAARNAAKGNG